MVEPPHRFEPTTVGSVATLAIDLRRRNIGTILWATGFRPDHSWLDVPVLDHKGRVRHDGGVVTDAPGMYLLGGSLLRTRRSSYIAGASHDTEALADHLHHYLASSTHTPQVVKAQRERQLTTSSLGREFDPLSPHPEDPRRLLGSSRR